MSHLSGIWNTETKAKTYPKELMVLRRRQISRILFRKDIYLLSRELVKACFLEEVTPDQHLEGGYVHYNLYAILPLHLE